MTDHLEDLRLSFAKLTKIRYEIKLNMESFWKKLEEELKVTITETDRRQILSQATREFLDKDIRYWEVDGLTYPRRPDEFREALLRKTAKAYFNARRPHATDSYPTT